MKSGLASLAGVSSDRDWRRYEEQIHDRLKQLAGPEAEVTFDVKLLGRFSGVQRQIDVHVRGSFTGIGDATLAVDCKCFASKIDVKQVEMVMGLVDDVGTDIGLLVTTEGFTPAAKRRAKGARAMWLDVVPYDQLADWEPDVLWCHVCTDLESEDFPGGVFMEPIEDTAAAGRCERCQAMHVRCACGFTNAADDEQAGTWLQCEGGCGVEWRFDAELDSDALPITEDPREQVEFRRGS